MAKTSAVRAAGVVLYRVDHGGTRVLLIHRPVRDDWSLPKGHVDRGESFKEAALREAEEETGITGTLTGLVGSVGYRVGKSHKVVRYYLMAANGSRFVPNREADDARWLSPERAIERSSYERDRHVIGRAAGLLERPGNAKVFLVRHAMAGKRSQWKGDDEVRPLSGVGRKQARSIGRHLVGYPITRLVSSGHVRCDETLQPAANALSLKVRHHRALMEGAPVDETFALIHRLAGHSAVLCSHGDVISRVIRRIADEGAELDADPRWAKGSVWELDVVDGSVVSGRYRPPR